MSQPVKKLDLPRSQKKIWAIGGGKGGIGKSFIISSFALSLARSGKTVTVVDLDLGSANLHTCLGAEIPKKTLGDFFHGRCTNLSELLTPTSVPGLAFISGANDALGAANITDEAQSRLLKELTTLPGEYLLIDLGAGTHQSTLDFFLLANRPIIGVTPEPTSIENAYRFIKAAYFRWIKNLEAQYGLKSVVDEAMDQKNNMGIKTPNDLIKHVISKNPQHADALKKEVEKFNLFLIMNQIRTKNDVDTGSAIASVCKKYFGIDVQYVGYLDYDNAVWQSVRKRRPLLLEHPFSNLVQSFAHMVKVLDSDEGSTRTNILRAA
ncbi:MAG: P-loop NTPase [Oligoflexia bacterium]|nr:P-loop NTPase [Oligoflexia bacterium]